MITAAFELLKQRVKTSKISTFIEGAEVLKKNRENLLDYITQTPRGTPLLNLFMALGDVLRQEQRDIIEKMQIIDRGIVSVKEVILMQQDYALVGLHNEYVQLSLLIEEAIQLQSAIIASNGIVIERNFDNIPAVFVQQNKLLNVLLTVITNSIDAMSDIHGGARRLCIEGHHDNALVRITIKDSGIGIASENLNRIFSPGFTTKKTGHGFGLHMCANAMVELGGSIQAQSDGLGNGATFTIHIPLPMERST
jgi:signal transduction histidine kinase